MKLVLILLCSFLANFYITAQTTYPTAIGTKWDYRQDLGSSVPLNSRYPPSFEDIIIKDKY
ncbi:MAG: hypothetical protein GY810_15535 [Aureispira sp.]|nr:hypothetical protein [Aureispira sp.]